MCWACLRGYTCALATEIPDFDIPGNNRQDSSTSASVSESVYVNLPGLSILLDFDPTPEFSYTNNGVIQASFYAYGPDGDHLYEMYMIFPETVSSGSVFTPESALQAGLLECSVVMLISTQTTEDLYVAGQYANEHYPAGTNYTIRFDSVADTAGGKLFSGTLSATMQGEDINNAPISEMLTITDAPFSFTMPSNTPSGNYSQTPVPGATPAPTPTVRPDMFRI